LIKISLNLITEGVMMIELMRNVYLSCDQELYINFTKETQAYLLIND